MHNILVIEDGKALQRALQRLFEAEGFRVQIAGDGTTGLKLMKASMPDAVLLDLGLPGMSGREVCGEIRKISTTVPILVVSAKTDVVDKVLLLELGANDYVTKPFSPRELLARVHVALRTKQNRETAETASFGEIRIDFEKMDVTRKGAPITMTAQEFRVLRYFLEHPERVVSREELLNQAWGYTNYPSTRTVDNHVLKLRQKLEEDPEQPKHFKTVHNVGYKFIP
jgi:two-component system, OmpR family, alkaline phosphatase synthesis response regulator PhoP